MPVSADDHAKAGTSSPGASAPRAFLGELLVSSKVISREQLEDVLRSPREPGKKIGQVLIERGWLSETQLVQTLSLQLSVPWVSLYHIDFSRQLLNRVTRDLAERYCLIPIFVRHVKGQGETLYVAMDDPTNEAALALVAEQAALPARPMIASATDIRSAIRVYYGEGEAASKSEPPPVPVAPGVSSVAANEPRPDARSAPPTKPPVPKHRPPPPPKKPAVSPSAPPLAAPPVGEVAPLSGEAALSSEAAPLSREAAPSSEAAPTLEGKKKRTRAPRMLALTLLDGTTIQLPARPSRKEAFASQEGLTARDFVSALRAAAHGNDASEVLGEKPQWEPAFAALLSILLRKGLIADWEFVEELRKI